MSKLIIDGNAVYEIDENCLKQKQFLKKNQTIKNNKTEKEYPPNKKT